MVLAGTNLGCLLIEKIGDAIHIVINLGNRALKAIVDSLGAFLDLVSELFKRLLGIPIQRLLDWLGLPFDWDDTVKMKNVLKNLINATMDYAASQAATAEKESHAVFDQIKKEIAQWGNNLGEAGKRDMSQTIAKQRSQYSHLNAVRQSPAANFSAYHVVHSGGVDAKAPPAPEVPPLAHTVMDEATAAFQKENDNNALLDKLIDSGTSMAELIAQPGTTLQAMSKTFAADVLATIVDILQKLTSTFLSEVSDVVAAINKALNSPVDVPLFSRLYRETVGSEPSVLDVFCLIIAIPSAAAARLAEGQSPFADGTGGLDSERGRDLIPRLIRGGKEAGPAGPGGVVMGPAAAGATTAQSDAQLAAKLYTIVGFVVYIIADTLMIAITPIQEESTGLAPFVPFLLACLMLAKFAATFPLGSGETWKISLIFWGFFAANVGLAFLAGVANLGQAQAVLDIFFACIYAVITVALIVAEAMELSGLTLVMGLIGDVEFFDRSAQQIVSAAGLFDQEYVSKQALIGASLLLNFSALALRGIRGAFTIASLDNS